MSDPDNSNMPEATLDKKGVLQRSRVFGTAEGKGGNSRPTLGMFIVEATRQGVVNAEAPKGQPDDVGEIWGAFAKSCAAAQGIGYVPLSSEKQQVSKLRAFARLGALPQVNGVTIINRAAELHMEMRRENEGKPAGLSPFDGLLEVARTQCAMPDIPLNDEQMKAVMSKPEPEDKCEADRLDKVADSMEKMRTDDKVSEETKTLLDEAIKPVLARIEELGGTTGQQKEAARQAAKDAKQRQAAVSLLVGKGFTVVPASVTSSPMLQAAE